VRYSATGQAVFLSATRLNKPSPKLDDHALTREILCLFKQDLSADQISGRLEALYPDNPEKQASLSTIYTWLYRETTQDPALKEQFRQKQAKPRHRKRTKDHQGRIPSMNARKSVKISPGQGIERGTPSKAPAKTPI
jgi:IS30 family transposase